MNASDKAYDFLEEFYTGGYCQLVEDVLNARGLLVQDDDMFGAAVIRDGECHVIFACGNLRKLLRFCLAVSGLYGVERVKWERTLCGKHEESRTYTLEQLKRYGKR